MMMTDLKVDRDLKVILLRQGRRQLSRQNFLSPVSIDTKLQITNVLRDTTFREPQFILMVKAKEVDITAPHQSVSCQ